MDAPCAKTLSIEEIYTSHSAWLQAWLRRRLGNATDAADLAHDVFIRLLTKPRSFETLPTAKAYLCSMAKGMCVDLWRRRQIEQAWLEELASRPDMQAPSAEQQAILLESIQALDAMLRRLPVKAARAFVMAVVCGMTDKEAAEELQVSTRMVRKYVARGMLHCLQSEIRQALD